MIHSNSNTWCTTPDHTIAVVHTEREREVCECEAMHTAELLRELRSGLAAAGGEGDAATWQQRWQTAAAAGWPRIQLVACAPFTSHELPHIRISNPSRQGGASVSESFID